MVSRSLETEQVGIGPLADETKTAPHPIRGEVEPVAWRWQWPGHHAWVYADYNLHPDAETVQPLYAHPPTSEGEGLREAAIPAPDLATREAISGAFRDTVGRCDFSLISDEELLDESVAFADAIIALLSSVRNGGRPE